MSLDVRRQRVEAHRVVFDEASIEKPFVDDHVHHRERERRVRARAKDDQFVRVPAAFGLADVDGDDVGPARACRGDVACGVGLARDVGGPHDDELAVGAHVFLRADLERAGEAQSVRAEAPAIDRA